MSKKVSQFPSSPSLPPSDQPLAEEQKAIDIVVEVEPGKLSVPIKMDKDSGVKLGFFMEGLERSRKVRSLQDLNFADPYVLYFVLRETVGGFNEEEYRALASDPAKQRQVSQGVFNRARQDANAFYEKEMNNIRNTVFYLSIIDGIFIMSVNPQTQAKVVSWNPVYVQDEELLENQTLTPDDFNDDLINVERAQYDLPPFLPRDPRSPMEQRLVLYDRLTAKHPTLAKIISDATQADVIASLQKAIYEQRLEETADPVTGFRSGGVDGDRTVADDATSQES